MPTESTEIGGPTSRTLEAGLPANSYTTIKSIDRRAIPPEARDDFVLDRWIDGLLKDARSRQS